MPKERVKKAFRARRALKKTEMLVEYKSMIRWLIFATVPPNRPDRGDLSIKSPMVWLMTSEFGRSGAKAASESRGPGAV